VVIKNHSIDRAAQAQKRSAGNGAVEAQADVAQERSAEHAKDSAREYTQKTPTNGAAQGGTPYRICPLHVCLSSVTNSLCRRRRHVHGRRRAICFTLRLQAFPDLTPKDSDMLGSDDADTHLASLNFLNPEHKIVLRNDNVLTTSAAQDQHGKLLLSVCSPFFRELLGGHHPEDIFSAACELAWTAIAVPRCLCHMGVKRKTWTCKDFERLQAAGMCRGSAGTQRLSHRFLPFAQICAKQPAFANPLICLAGNATS
jgi:hypothetical protein